LESKKRYSDSYGAQIANKGKEEEKGGEPQEKVKGGGGERRGDEENSQRGTNETKRLKKN